MGRLKLQYFLTYAVNGCLLPFVPLYLQQMGLDRAQISNITAIAGLAIVFSPVFVTLIADAHLEARRVLFGLLSLSGLALVSIPVLSGFWPILAGFVLLNIVFVPAMPLQDGIAFAIARNEQKNGIKSTPYHKIRVWGTIGFLFPGLLLYLLIRHWTYVTVVLYVAAIFAAIAAMHALLLPRLPRNQSILDRKLPTAEAARALFGRRMIVFCLASFLLQMAAASYYTFYPLYLSEDVGLPKAYAGMIMNIGQAIEIAFMLGFGRLTRALGPRRFMLLAASLMALRMVLLAAFPTPAVAIGTQVFHGIMVLLLQVGPVVLIDRVASDQFRHSIQGLYAMLVLGGGRIVGNFVVGPIAKHGYTDAYWWSASLIAAALLLLTFGYWPQTIVLSPAQKDEKTKLVARSCLLPAAIGGLLMKKIVVAVAVLVVAALVIWVIAFRPGGPASATAMAPQKLPVRSTAEQERLIYEAVDRNDIAAVRTLLAGAPSVALANSGQNGETPLHLARSVEMAQLLLDAGADPNARDRTYDARPSRWAISNWRPEVVAFLDSKAPPDTDIAALCATGKLPQLMAMLQKDRALAQGKTSGRDVLGANRSLLHVAALYGQAEVCRVLATHGADVASEGGFFNAQPLEFAAWAGFPDTVKALIEYGADVNAQVVAGDQGTHTAIWWAALTGRKEVVAILLDAGASIEPDLIAAVRKSEASPYPGRALPPREDYDAVIELLQKHVDAPRNGK